MKLLPKILSVGPEVAAGVNPDLHADNQSVWQDSRNVTITAAGIAKMVGWESSHTTANTKPVRGMEQMLSNGDEVLIYGAPEALYRMVNGTETDISRGTYYNGRQNAGGSDIASSWSMVEWGNWMVASNGIDPIQLYRHGVDTRFENLDGPYGADDPPARAEILQKLGPHVIAFNTDEGQNAYEWCDEDNLAIWIPSAANGAGGNVIRDFDSEVVACQRLGDRIAVYGVDRMAIMSYLGAPFYFGVKFALKHIGAISKNSVVADGRKNYGFGRRGFFITDGTSHKYIDDGSIRDTVFSEINWDQASKVCAYHKADRGEIIWYYPTGTNLEPNKGVAFNYLRGGWHFLDHGRTSGLEQRIFDTPYTAGSDGTIYKESTGTDADGSAMTAYAQSKATPFFSGEDSLEDYVKYVEAVKLSIIGKVGGQIKFKVGYKMELEDEWTWKTMYIQKDPKVPLFPKVSGKWFTFRIESDQLSDAWELQGFMVHGKVIGGKIK